MRTWKRLSSQATREPKQMPATDNDTPTDELSAKEDSVEFTAISDSALAKENGFIFSKQNEFFHFA